MTAVLSQRLLPAEAADWVSESLRLGHGLSAATLAILPAHAWLWWTFLPAGVAVDAASLRESAGLRTTETDEALASFLEHLATSRALTLIVEDDVLRRGDPAIARRGIPSAFTEDNYVVHWCELGNGDGRAAVKMLRRASTGYALNAFVVEKPPSALELADGRDISAALASEVTASLLAIVVSAFDGESFVACQRK